MITINDLNHVWEYLYYNRCKEDAIRLCIEAEQYFKGNDLRLQYDTDPETGDPYLCLMVCFAKVAKQTYKEEVARFKDLEARVDKFRCDSDLPNLPIQVMVGY